MVGAAEEEALAEVGKRRFVESTPRGSRFLLSPGAHCSGIFEDSNAVSILLMLKGEG